MYKPRDEDGFDETGWIAIRLAAKPRFACPHDPGRLAGKERIRMNVNKPGDDAALNQPELLGIEQVSSGWLNKYLLEYRLPDGTLYQYEAISRKDLEAYKAELERNAGRKGAGGRRPDGVCIVPMLSDGSILLIREFRYAVNAWVIALPAGLVEPDEDLEECIDRELREETGYKLKSNSNGLQLKLLPKRGYSSAGMTDESVGVAIAQVEPCGESDLQGEELIESFTLKVEDVADFLESNEDLIGTRCQLVLESLAGTFEAE